jgi:hypothetical protein
MTKKDFQLIADILKSSDLPANAHATVSMNFAVALKRINPRFNTQLFIDACAQPVNKSESQNSTVIRALDCDLAKHL